MSERNPFIRFRPFLYAYRVAIARGMTDEEYVDLVDRCTAAVTATDNGTEVEITPLSFDEDLVRD